MSELRVQEPPVPVIRRFEPQPARPGALRAALGVQPAAQEVRTPDATLEVYPPLRRGLSERELWLAYGLSPDEEEG